jgi:hypothetical protein
VARSKAMPSSTLTMQYDHCVVKKCPLSDERISLKQYFTTKSKDLNNADPGIKKELEKKKV